MNGFRPQLDMTRTTINKIRKDKSYRLQLFRATLSEHETKSPYNYMVAYRDRMNLSVDLIDETINIAVMFYKKYQLRVVVDRDEFEVVLRVKKDHYSVHLDGWRWCMDFKGYSWEQFETYLIALMNYGIENQ